ncbi:Uncharacterised protein [Mycobacteroides abscessus]|nr:Uncharacterised protein [Mycobacteroides abscessus]
MQRHEVALRDRVQHLDVLVLERVRVPVHGRDEALVAAVAARCRVVVAEARREQRRDGVGVVARDRVRVHGDGGGLVLVRAHGGVLPRDGRAAPGPRRGHGTARCSGVLLERGGRLVVRDEVRGTCAREGVA